MKPIVIVLILLALAVTAGCTAYVAPTPPPAPVVVTPAPVAVRKTLNLKLTKSAYTKYGDSAYFEVTGVLTNTCGVSVYSPTIKLEIYSADGKVLLADDTAWAAGTMFEDFPSGSSAAIDFYTAVSGAPQNIKYRLTCKDATLTIVYVGK